MTTGFKFQFTVSNANRLLRTLILFEIFLAVLFLISSFSDMPRSITILFDMDGEANIPAWFSSVQLFSIGVVFLFSTQWPRNQQMKDPWFLLLVGAGFIFLSMDEAAIFHEKITAVLKHVEWIPRFKGNHGIWIPVYIMITTGLFVMGKRAIFSMVQVYYRQVLIMATGFVILVVGGVFMEVISYWYLRGAHASFYYIIEVALEEFFEMVGASVILYGTVLCAIQDAESTRAEKYKS